MRPHIAHLDTEGMDWESRVPGAYFKILNVDPDNGARTALQRLVPDEGYTAPTVAHYHHSDEEILVVKGKLSFDSKTFIGRLGYCFHPAETVHGFKSSVPVETMFLSRHSQKMDTEHVEEPTQQTYYSIAEKSRTRGLAVLPDPNEGHWEKGDDGSESLDLGTDTETGEGSKFVRISAGGAADFDLPGDFYQELFVLDGSLPASDGTEFKRGAYSFCPPGESRPKFSKTSGALVYVNFGPAP
jgi:quercetin dioxygenase-like cupin family protein